jgi:hypothetical protein
VRFLDARSFTADRPWAALDLAEIDGAPRKPLLRHRLRARRRLSDQPCARWQTRRVLAHVVLLTACACLLVVSATQAVLFARRGELNGVRA